MLSIRRIRSIYTKELTELLRDRRTLIAMIVVPITLYPLLIIGSVHLLTVREDERQYQRIVVAVPKPHPAPAAPTDNPQAQLRSVFAEVKRIVANQAGENRTGENRAEENQTEEEDARQRDARLESLDKIVVQAYDDPRAAVVRGQAQVAVIVELADRNAPQAAQDIIHLYYDKAETSSEAALNRVRDALEIFADAQRDHNLAVLQLSKVVLEPIRIDVANVASPKKVGGMILGSIVPLVLVLMTITGAIYPAIDLTAGERERGTLETLIVCPVPPMELITGKYLVVTTVALLGAALNLLSMGATLYFGGFAEMIGTRGDTELPFGVLPIILIALVPFALLFSAIMVAVCSYARTFKEAQNYIMPVILAALIPGGIAALPGTELAGAHAVVPVMNMVLMARELLLGHYAWGTIALVLCSTTLYAAAAVIVASRVFSTEAVVFADSASLRSVFIRRLIKPAEQPSVSLTLILIALLFPTWMFVQFSIQPGPGENILDTFRSTARYMPVLLVLVPAAVLAYFKVNLRETFALHAPRPRYWLAALLIGAGAWAPAHELFVLQNAVFPVPKVIFEANAQMTAAFAKAPLWLALLLIAIIPAVCEELLFRGLLLSGLRRSTGKWTAIVVSACVFAVFHFLLVKFALTAGLGVLLGMLCWQARSIGPSMLAHALHNATAVLLVLSPALAGVLGITDPDPMAHLPLPIIVVTSLMVAAGVGLCVIDGSSRQAARNHRTTEPRV